ncbi:MAG: RNA 2',3'-cyclic phosphodiesterase [Rubrivivax sp.]
MNGGAKEATARLFLALWPDRPLRHALAAWRDRWTWPPGAAVVPDDRLHLTLHFIGPVPRSRLPAVQATLGLAFERFEIEFGLPALWPRGLALLEPLAPPPALLSLHAALAERLHALALPVEERRFRPHVTLARNAAGALPPPEPPALRWTVSGYALVESERGYRTLASWPAAGTA